VANKIAFWAIRTSIVFSANFDNEMVFASISVSALMELDI